MIKSYQGKHLQVSLKIKKHKPTKKDTIGFITFMAIIASLIWWWAK